LEILTLEKAVALALEHHPSLKSADAGQRVAAAGLRQATAGYLPVLNFTGTGTHTEGAFVFNPSFPPRDQSYDSYSASVQLQQTLWDFGKTSNRVGASMDLVDASDADFETARNNVVMNVQLAYFGHMQSLQVAGVAHEAVRQAEQHLAQARAFYAVGKRPQFDVTKAGVDLANANVALIRARNQTQIARLQLENAMGTHPVQPYAVADTFTVVPLELSLDSLTLAWNRRPDLRGATARLSAQENLADAASSLHWPTISVNGAYTWTNFTWPLFSRWNAGLSVTFPIFQGFSLVAGEQLARANADASRASLESLAQTAMLDVEQYYLALREAEERLGATAKLVEQAGQSYTLAERQYAAGIATAIEVTDAQVTLSNAKITRIQALYDYNSARTRLLMAVGDTRTP
jgi:outer membrane protein TolC